MKCSTNRKTPNFAYGNFPKERDLISVKEDCYAIPKFLTGTFLNANIKSNSDGGSQMGETNNGYKI